MKRRVYLVNISFGLAGIERRFANLWRTFHQRGVVRPILVIPTGLAKKLDDAGLLPDEPGAVMLVEEPWPIPYLGRLRLPNILETPRALVRSRVVARRFRIAWSTIERDPDAVMHIGMPCSALRPPDMPTVFECVDANLGISSQFRRASTRRSIIHCQTERIRVGLDARFAPHEPRWQTVTSPAYFAHYDEAPPTKTRDSRLVAFVGRLHAIKNPLLFIEGVAAARYRGCDCHAIMLGEGPLQPQVDALIKRHGLGEVISVVFHSDAPSILGTAAAYISLQTGDNYGSQALLEAMGAGCAIIASDVGQTGQIVTDEVGVRIPLTAEAVAAAIECLVSSPERTRKLGERASHIARTQYSADAYAAFLESLYERAARYHSGTNECRSAEQRA